MSLWGWLLAFNLGLYEPSPVINPYLSHRMFPHTEVGWSEQWRNYPGGAFGVPGIHGYYRPEWFEGLTLPINRSFDLALGYKEGSSNGPYVAFSLRLDTVCWLHREDCENDPPGLTEWDTHDGVIDEKSPSP